MSEKKFIKLIGTKQDILDSLKKQESSPTYKRIMDKRAGNTMRMANPSIATDNAEQISEDIGIFTQAELLLEQICEGTLQIGALNLTQKASIFYYLERYNKRVGRIVDVFTRIPLSSLRLQKPNTKWNVVNDYVLYKFEMLFNSKGFQDVLEKLIKHYWLFSYGAVLIEDDFDFVRGIDTAEFENLDKIVSIMNDGKKNIDIERLKDIDKRYLETPDLVLSSERMEVIESILNIHSPNYKGIFKLSVLPTQSSITRFENNDIGYYVYQIPITQNILQTIGAVKEGLEQDEQHQSDFIEQLRQIGYSQAMVEATLDLNNSSSLQGKLALYNLGNKNAIPVDNDAFNNLGMYVATFQRAGLSNKDNSLFNRVLSDCITLQIATRRQIEKMNRGYQKIVLVEVDEKLAEDKVAELNDALLGAVQSGEGTALAVNFSVSTNDVELTPNDDLDLSDIIENAENNILEGAGVPSSLITDSDDAYSNSFLKTTILENEMTSFRTALADFVENQIFKPLAIKWGFMAQGEWGECEVIYPKLRFTKFSLARGSDDLVFMQELAENGQLPLSDIYEALGIDMQEALQKVKQEQSSLLNPDLKEVYSEKIGELAGQLLEAEAQQGESKLMQGIAENLGLKTHKLERDEDSEDSNNNDSFNKNKRFR